jgi:hypothetical protein
MYAVDTSHLSTSMSTISPHDIDTPLPPNLSKLNVSQLKAICKERRIVGYSKLGKAALIRKLGELGPSSLSSSSAQSTRVQAQANSLLSVPGSSPAQVDESLAPSVQRPMGTPSLSPCESNTIPGTHIPQSSATSGPITAFHPPSCLSGGRGQNVGHQSASSLKVPVSKRISSEISQGPVHAGPLAKKPKVSSPLSALVATPASVHLLDNCGGVPKSLFSSLPGSALVPGIKEGHQLDCRTQTIAMSGKRFKPLKVTRPLSATLGDRRKSPCLQGSRSATVTVQPSLLWHLDFPTHPEPPLLSVIAIPPPLSQRKLVQRWAIILSGLSGKERFLCCLVSKLIRYAGERRVLD